MMRKSQWLCQSCLFISLSFIFASCSFVYYAPNQPHIPVLKNKNDFEVKAAYSGESFGDVEALEAQIAYSPLKYWSVNYNFAHFYSDRSEKNHGNSTQHEFGTGFYFPLTRYLYLNGNVSYAQSTVYHYYELIPQHSSYKTQRWSFMPGFNWGNQYVNVYGALRFSSVGFSNGIIPRNLMDREKDELEFLLRKNNFLVIDRTFGIKGGYKYIFLGLQLTFSTANRMVWNGRGLYAPDMMSFFLNINQELFNIKSKKVQIPGTLY